MQTNIRALPTPAQPPQSALAVAEQAAVEARKVLMAELQTIACDLAERALMLADNTGDPQVETKARTIWSLAVRAAVSARMPSNG